MRSWVCCGIDLAAGERLITRETVAGESCNCAANDFRLTDGADAFPRADFGIRATFDGASEFCSVVCHSLTSGTRGRVFYILAEFPGNKLYPDTYSVNRFTQAWEHDRALRRRTHSP